MCVCVRCLVCVYESGLLCVYSKIGRRWTQLGYFQGKLPIKRPLNIFYTKICLQWGNLSDRGPVYPYSVELCKHELNMNFFVRGN